MALVDLRGREQEPEVLALLAPDPAWSLLGWSSEGVLVACAGFERVDGDELAVRALASRDDAAATSLLNAVAGVARGSRIVARAEGSTSGIYRAAGFAPRRASTFSCATSPTRLRRPRPRARER